jgi:PKHD-type hydroxylase
MFSFASKFPSSIFLPENITPFVYFNDIFNHDELHSLTKYCRSLETVKARTTKNIENDDYRKTDIGRVILNSDTEFFYQRISEIVVLLNSKSYDFELSGFYEDLDYLRYDSAEQAHFELHTDNVVFNQPGRKLSVVLQLSDPSEYEGGELQIIMNKDPITIPKNKGMLVIFPSYTVHKVTAVTRGVRETIVGWVTGPRFK